MWNMAFTCSMIESSDRMTRNQSARLEQAEVAAEKKSSAFMSQKRTLKKKKKFNRLLPDSESHTCGQTLSDS